jgi:hypothetical protein
MTLRSAALFICAAWAGTASASVREMTLEEMTRESLGIVRGVVKELRPRFEGQALLTDVIVEVRETYKGELRGTLVLTLMGGRIGDYEVVATDLPRFAVGEEFFAFVSRGPSGLWPTAGFTGKYTIQRLRRARNEGPAVVVGVPGAPVAKDVTLAELEASVKAILAAAAGRKK